MSTRQPTGWMKNVAIALFAAVAAMLIAWIWLGDWRWGATAGVVFVVAFVFLSLSIQDRTPGDQRKD
ncbi:MULTISPECIES: hypothetical protein [Spongiactinospora]|uniref:hypothetical protein n=1 Tax=Spongiactinospora TaxID=2871671 RepID=UPI0011B94C48|nr:hypothetical protein [Spongiactinospora gelatinilytica]